MQSKRRNKRRVRLSVQEFSDWCIFCAICKYNMNRLFQSLIWYVFCITDGKPQHPPPDTTVTHIWPQRRHYRDSRIFTLTLSIFSIFPSFFETVKSSLTVVGFATLCLAKLWRLYREGLKLYYRSYKLRNSGHFVSFAPVYNDYNVTMVLLSYTIDNDATLSSKVLYFYGCNTFLQTFSECHHKQMSTVHTHT